MIKENLIELYENSFKRNWDNPGLSDYSTRERLLYKNLAEEIAKVHLLLCAAEIKRGDKVALIGKNNIPWCVSYLSVITYGAVVVPILQDFHPDNVQHIIHHSESVLLFSSEHIWDELNQDKLPALRGALSINDLRYRCIYELSGDKLTLASNQLEQTMAEKYPNGLTKEDIKYAKVDNSELVLINYTSGTTGFSKGVMLTANNLAGNITHAHYLKLLVPGKDIVSFLPLAHAYGCAFEFLYSLTEGSHTTLLGKTPSPKILTEAFKEIKPYLIISVPLVIEKIYKKVLLPKIEKPSIKVALKIPLVRERIYAKIKNGLMQALGGNFHEIIIGGAALNSEVEAFLRKIKFPFTVGYGMTECGPLISYDHNYDFIPTSCGKVLDNIMEVRIDSTDPYSVVGEIQVRGENVMKGYYKNEEATKAAFTADGWLRTGDLGTIDKDNRIFIRGRSKTMLLGPSGQNIFPEEIEDKLNNLPYVQESIVIQRNQKLVALIYPDYETMDAENVTQEMLPDLMEANRKALNGNVAAFESISAIQIYPGEFEKTPKKSIKRYLYEN